MTDQTLAAVTVEEKDGKFFYSINDAEFLAGPYETEEAAVDAATDFLESAFAEMVKQSLFGDE